MKSYLLERLPDFLGLSHFQDLSDAIEETMQTMKVQLKHLEEMAVILNFEYTGQTCNDLVPYAELCYELSHLALDDTELAIMPFCIICRI